MGINSPQPWPNLAGGYLQRPSKRPLHLHKRQRSLGAQVANHDPRDRHHIGVVNEPQRVHFHAQTIVEVVQVRAADELALQRALDSHRHVAPRAAVHTAEGAASKRLPNFHLRAIGSQIICCRSHHHAELGHLEGRSRAQNKRLLHRHANESRHKSLGR